MKNKLKLLCWSAVLTSCLFLIPVTPSFADPVLFSNGAPTAGGNLMTSYLQADDFTLSGPTTLTGLRFWSVENASPSAYQGSISWFIYGDSGNKPGTLLASGNTADVTRVQTKVVDGFSVEYQNDLDLNLGFLGGGTFWLGLHNGPLGTTSPTGLVDFSWAASADNASLSSVQKWLMFPGLDWTQEDTPREHAFELYGLNGIPDCETLDTCIDPNNPNPNPNPVPEPGTLTLLGSGLAGLLTCLKRRAK